jgi:hypothetical protein
MVHYCSYSSRLALRLPIPHYSQQFLGLHAGPCPQSGLCSWAVPLEVPPRFSSHGPISQILSQYESYTERVH